MSGRKIYNQVFVSSTFRDMHDELDLMRQYFLPETDKAAFEFGKIMELRDPKRGVTRSESDSEEKANWKVLMMCLKKLMKTVPI